MTPNDTITVFSWTVSSSILSTWLASKIKENQEEEEEFWMFIVRWNHFLGSVLVLFWGGNSQKLKPHQENNTSNSFETNSFNMCVCLLYMYIARCAGKNLKGNRALECQQALTLAGKVITECIWKIMSLSWQMTRVSDWPHWSCSCAFSGKQTNKQTNKAVNIYSWMHNCDTTPTVTFWAVIFIFSFSGFLTHCILNNRIYSWGIHRHNTWSGEVNVLNIPEWE